MLSHKSYISYIWGTQVIQVVYDIRARWSRTNSPLCENMRSTGAELAGVHNIRSNNGSNKASSDL